MKTCHLLCACAFTSAALLTGSAIAADASVTTTQIQNNPAPTAPAVDRAMPGPQSVGGSERVDNTNTVVPNAVPLEAWMDYDVPTNYAARNRALPPRTGADVIPGYMGPGSVKGE